MPCPMPLCPHQHRRCWCTSKYGILTSKSHLLGGTFPLIPCFQLAPREAQCVPTWDAFEILKGGLSVRKIFRYYSTQRPIGPGTIPSTSQYPPLEAINYDQRIPVENGAMLAWGEVHYAFPLSENQLYDYELKAARDNPPVHKRHPAKNKAARDCR